MKKRKTYSAGFKTKIILEALQERETVQEIARKYELHPGQISTWKIHIPRGSGFSREVHPKQRMTRKETFSSRKLDSFSLRLTSLKSIGEIAKKDRMTKD